MAMKGHLLKILYFQKPKPSTAAKTYGLDLASKPDECITIKRSHPCKFSEIRTRYNLDMAIKGLQNIQPALKT